MITFEEFLLTESINYEKIKELSEILFHLYVDFVKEPGSSIAINITRETVKERNSPLKYIHKGDSRRESYRKEDGVIDWEKLNFKEVNQPLIEGFASSCILILKSKRGQDYIVGKNISTPLLKRIVEIVKIMNIEVFEFYAGSQAAKPVTPRMENGDNVACNPERGKSYFQRTPRRKIVIAFVDENNSYKLTPRKIASVITHEMTHSRQSEKFLKYDEEKRDQSISSFMKNTEFQLANDIMYSRLPAETEAHFQEVLVNADKEFLSALHEDSPENFIHQWKRIASEENLYTNRDLVQEELVKMLIKKLGWRKFQRSVQHRIAKMKS